MFIKAMTIDATDGIDVEFIRSDDGVLVVKGERDVFQMRRDDADDVRFEAARQAARLICGTDRANRERATNSMIHDVLREMQRVAGC